jgi:hypothetical protein
LGSLWLLIPPWLCSVIVTLIGRWGERRLVSPEGASQPTSERSSRSIWFGLANLLFTNLIFLSLLPTIVLMMFQPMMPFLGARAGLALALAAFLFGIAPLRLIDAPQRGWNHAFWILFIDLLRVGGSLTLIGWLLTR